MSNEAKLGTIPKGDEGRDAVHVAIVPACAGEPLLIGSPVRMNSKNKAVACKAKDAIGVVDPFIAQNQGGIDRDSWFWLCLYPKTITGLRHVWEHPWFDVVQKQKESEKWLRDFIASADCPDYDTVIAAALGEHVDEIEGYGGPAYQISRYGTESYLTFLGRDAHSSIPPEFWDHVENVTGKKCPVRATGFSCSC